MAKPDKKEKEKTATEDFKYGVEDLADALGIKPASARVQLRNNNIEKAGKSYGWNSKSELEEVVKQLSKKSEKTEKKADKKEPKEVTKKKVVTPAAKKVKKEAA